MKTIFRSFGFGLVLAAIFALGAVASMAQDPCQDAEGITTASNKVREDFTNWKNLSQDDKKKALDNSKAFVDKYGSCDPAKDLAKYVTDNSPAMAKAVANTDKLILTKAKEDRYNNAVKAANTDEILAAAKDLLAYDVESYRPVELALASLGYDESIKTGKTGKYTEESLRYARQAISDLEGGKVFRTFNAGGTYSFKDNADALAWMNASVGYLTFLKDRKAGLPFLYKATQSPTSTTAKESILYQAIGDYYRDEARRLTKEAIDKANGMKADATLSQDAIKAGNDEIDAKNALSFGYAERALDAYARAFKTSTTPAAQAAMKKIFSDLYDFRFDKTDGIDAWIATAVAKPFPNPATPVDPVKIETTTPGGEATTAGPGSGVGAANGKGIGAANGTGIGGANGTGIGGANGTGVGGASGTGVKSTTTTPVKSTTPPVKKPGVKRSATVAKKKVG